jgi:hypothetical protein
MDDVKRPKPHGGWTVAVLMAGLTTIGVCVVIPQADANRRLEREQSRLSADLAQINQQTAVNEQFLATLENDPQLAQRLAQRQMKFIRQGESLLPYKSAQNSGALIASEVSPYSLVAVPAPTALAAYQPPGGLLGKWLLDSRIRLDCLAAGFFLVAVGLILGSNDVHAQCPGA